MATTAADNAALLAAISTWLDANTATPQGGGTVTPPPPDTSGITWATIPHVLNDWSDAGQVALNGKKYFIESSMKPYAAQLSTNTATPIFRGEVRNGELWSGADGGNDTERAELDGTPTIYPKGTEFWFGYQFIIEPGADQIATTGGAPGSPLAWGAVGQIHGNGKQAAVPWQLSIVGDKLSVRTQQGAQVEKIHWTDTAKLVRDKIYSVVVKIKITGATTSTMTCWINGVQVANSTGLTIGGADAGNYVKAGIYRGWQGDGYPPLAVQIANIEHGTGSLLSRVTNPLAWPTVK